LLLQTKRNKANETLERLVDLWTYKPYLDDYVHNRRIIFSSLLMFFRNFFEIFSCFMLV